MPFNCLHESALNLHSGVSAIFRSLLLGLSELLLIFVQISVALSARL